MIVISPALSLSLTPAEAADSYNPVIGWHNEVTVTNVVATNEATGYPASNLANPTTQPPWKGTTTTGTTYLTVSPGTADDRDYLAVAGHNFGSSLASVSVETWDGSSPVSWTQVIAPFVPSDDSPLLFRFVRSGYPGVRLRIDSVGTAPQAAVLYVGRLLVLERSIRVDVGHKVITMARQSNISTGRSENGKFLGRIVLSEWNESQADFSYFDPTWFRTYMVPFIKASDDTPYFFAWNPMTYSEDVGFLWTTEDPDPETDPITQCIRLVLKHQGIVR